MDVLLVGAELEENLALRYLGASLRRAGHRPIYATFNNEGDTAGVLRILEETRPGLVGLSMTFQFRAQEFGALAQAMRDAGYRGHITGGGHFPTFAFSEVLSAFPALDSIVRHEGERAIVEMADALARGAPNAIRELAGLVTRADDGAITASPARSLELDLDALPFPDRTGEPQLHLGIPAAFIVGTRGCYGSCTFCCIHAYLKSAGGPKYRLRGAENVADEMAALRRTRGCRMFVFHDDDFFTRDAENDLARVTALRDALRERGVTDVALVVKARPDDVDDRVFSVLREIGLLRVYLGIEAGSTQGLRILGRGVDLAENRRALDYLRERDVYTCYNMLVFDPESRLESLRDSFGFVREYADVPMNFCRTEIYVGTPLMTKLEREGRLRGDVFGWDYEIRDPRAERAFRVFAHAFLDRNFRCDGLMNSTLGVGYHLHLLRTFYPGTITESLRERTTSVVRKVNLDCVSRMEEVLAWAADPRSESPAAFEDFAERVKLGVVAANKPLEDEVHEVTNAIIQAAMSPRREPRDPAMVRAKRALSAATAALMLSPLACEPSNNPPPPPDPLPPPTMVQPSAKFVQPPPPDPLPPPTMIAPPPDPPPPPVVIAPKDAGVPRPPPPPPDPLPPPRIKK